MIQVLNEYLIKCKESDLKPAKFFLSFSPVDNVENIAFIKWLGAEINEKTENRISSAQNIGEESIRIVLEVLHKIFDSFDKLKVNVPLRLNIEYISLHNLELSKKLVNTISDNLEKYKYILN